MHAGQCDGAIAQVFKFWTFPITMHFQLQRSIAYFEDNRSDWAQFMYCPSKNFFIISSQIANSISVIDNLNVISDLCGLSSCIRNA